MDFLAKDTESPKRFHRRSTRICFRRDIVTSLLLTALVLVSSTAYSHSWYPKDCRHGQDCRPVPCDELIETRYGLMWRGRVLFSETQVWPSLDRFCYVCAKEQQGTIILCLPLCAFVAPTS
jgi:hypothetical protein